MWVRAIKEHGYRGKRIPIGREYEITSPTDAAILKVAGFIKEVKKTANMAKTETPVAKTEVPVVETREEVPEEVSEEILYEVGESSPPDKIKLTRKQRRQYKRKDMTPEE